METKSGWAPGLGVSVLGAERIEGHWIIVALGPELPRARMLPL
jgi:hypothetical protein